MTQFRDYLEREGIDPGGLVEINLPIKQNNAFLKKGLIAPRLPKESSFAGTVRFMLGLDPAAKVVLDMSVQVERLGSARDKLLHASFHQGSERRIPQDQLTWLNWETLYLDILAYKEERGFHNLVVRPEHPVKSCSLSSRCMV